MGLACVTTTIIAIPWRTQVPTPLQCTSSMIEYFIEYTLPIADLMFTRSCCSTVSQYAFFHSAPPITPLKPNPLTHSFCPFFRNVSCSSLLTNLVSTFSVQPLFGGTIMEKAILKRSFFLVHINRQTDEDKRNIYKDLREFFTLVQWLACVLGRGARWLQVVFFLAFPEQAPVDGRNDQVSFS